MPSVLPAFAAEAAASAELARSEEASLLRRVASARMPGHFWTLQPQPAPRRLVRARSFPSPESPVPSPCLWGSRRLFRIPGRLRLPAKKMFHSPFLCGTAALGCARLGPFRTPEGRRATLVKHLPNSPGGRLCRSLRTPNSALRTRWPPALRRT